MLVAMMSPTLISPIHHVRERSFKRWCARSVILFVFGYAAIWIAAGCVLIAAMLMLNLFAPQSYLPVIVVGIIAFVWQCTPIKQRCLNRSHNHSELAAFGIAADLDALRFGITHGGLVRLLLLGVDATAYAAATRAFCRDGYCNLRDDQRTS